MTTTMTAAAGLGVLAGDVEAAEVVLDSRRAAYSAFVEGIGDLAVLADHVRGLPVGGWCRGVAAERLRVVAAGCPGVVRRSENLFVVDVSFDEAVEVMRVVASVLGEAARFSVSSPAGTHFGGHLLSPDGGAWFLASRGGGWAVDLGEVVSAVREPVGSLRRFFGLGSLVRGRPDCGEVAALSVAWAWGGLVRLWSDPDRLVVSAGAPAGLVERVRAEVPGVQVVVS